LFQSPWFFPPLSVLRYPFETVAISHGLEALFLLLSVLLVEKSQNALQGHQQHVVGSDFCPIKRFHLVSHKVYRKADFY